MRGAPTSNNTPTATTNPTHQQQPTTTPTNTSEEIVVPLRSDTVEEMESNVARIAQWVADYKRQHGLA